MVIIDELAHTIMRVVKMKSKVIVLRNITLSHELKTPIAPNMMSSKLLGDERALLADAEKRRGGLLNLLINAIRFPPSYSKVILLIKKPGKDFEFSVTNSGKG